MSCSIHSRLPHRGSVLYTGNRLGHASTSGSPAALVSRLTTPASTAADTTTDVPMYLMAVCAMVLTARTAD